MSYYFLTRLDQRPDKMIQYLLEKNLLSVVFPLEEETHRLCEKNFKTYFTPTDGFAAASNHEPLTGTQFIALYFLAGMITMSQEQRILLLKNLSEQIVFFESTGLSIIGNFFTNMVAVSDDEKMKITQDLHKMFDFFKVNTQSLNRILAEAPYSLEQYHSKVNAFRKSLRGDDRRTPDEQKCMKTIYHAWFVFSEQPPIAAAEVARLPAPISLPTSPPSPQTPNPKAASPSSSPELPEAHGVKVSVGRNSVFATTAKTQPAKLQTATLKPDVTANSLTLGL